MRRWTLSKRDRKKIVDEVRHSLGFVPFSAKDELEILVDEDVEVLIYKGLPAFIKIENLWVPHLRLIHSDPQVSSILPKLVVDEGAVKPILRGADVMRPGIVRIEGSFTAGSVVVVAEPIKRVAIAVHKALYDSDAILGMERGRVTKRLHYIGDKYWKLLEKLR